MGRGREGSRGRSYVYHIRRELGGRPFSAARIRPVITCRTKHTSPAWTGLCPRMGRPVRTLTTCTARRALGVSALRKGWTGGVSPDKSGEAESQGLGPPGACLGLWRDPARQQGFPAKLMRVLAACSRHWQATLALIGIQPCLLWRAAAPESRAPTSETSCPVSRPLGGHTPGAPCSVSPTTLTAPLPSPSPTSRCLPRPTQNTWT